MSKSEHPEEWRDRLREAVNRTGKKHSYIASEAGVAPETLSRVLTSRSSQPSFDVVVRITRAAGESVGWILGEAGFIFSAEERTLLTKAAELILEREDEEWYVAMERFKHGR